MLMRHSVSAFMTNFDGPHISSVSFQMKMPGRLEPVGFRLPCNWRAIEEMFNNDPDMRRNARMKKGELTWENQAARVAWRIVRDWIEAQLALVEVNMVTVPQVFLPYVVMKDDRTLSEHVASDSKFLLGDGN